VAAPFSVFPELASLVLSVFVLSVFVLSVFVLSLFPELTAFESPVFTLLELSEFSLPDLPETSLFVVPDAVLSGTAAVVLLPAGPSGVSPFHYVTFSSNLLLS